MWYKELSFSLVWITSIACSILKYKAYSSRDIRDHVTYGALRKVPAKFTTTVILRTVVIQIAEVELKAQIAQRRARCRLGGTHYKQAQSYNRDFPNLAQACNFECSLIAAWNTVITQKSPERLNSAWVGKDLIAAHKNLDKINWKSSTCNRCKPQWCHALQAAVLTTNPRPCTCQRTPSPFRSQMPSEEVGADKTAQEIERKIWHRKWLLPNNPSTTRNKDHHRLWFVTFWRHI